MKTSEMDLSRLCEPFPATDIEWRIGRCGIQSNKQIYVLCLAYITNRAIQDRLDEVVGPENWQDQYVPWKGGAAQLCGISIRMRDGEWVTKWDGADDTDFEKTKGGLSDAEKRAGVKWGIGRYLYQLGESFATVSSTKIPGYKYAHANVAGKNQPENYQTFYWLPPSLPSWALPPHAQPGTPHAQPLQKQEPGRVAALGEYGNMLHQLIVGEIGENAGKHAANEWVSRATGGTEKDAVAFCKDETKAEILFNTVSEQIANAEASWKHQP